MTTITTPPPAISHAVSRATAAIHTQLDQVTDTALWSMSPEETAATLTSITRASSRLAELEARVAAHAATVRVGSAVGATSTANWWAHTTGLTRPEAHRKTRLAAALASGTHDPVRDALAAGDLVVQQAEAIIDAVAKLPDNLDPAQTQRAERHLIHDARDNDARALRIIGKRLLEVIAPDAADAHEAQLLDQEETRAAAAARLTLTDDGHGTTHGRFTLPTVQGAMLKKMLLALAAPKHRTATQDPDPGGEPGPGAAAERKPAAERLGEAFRELIERYPTTKIPHAGGLSATAVILIPLDTLLGGLKAAHLDLVRPTAA
jgi:hypothetical protein